MAEIDDGDNNNEEEDDVAPSHQTLTLALPANGTASSSATTHHSNNHTDAWSDAATSALIDAWSHLYLHLSRGILKPHHWHEVSAAVAAVAASKSDAQCKTRIETLKKRYRSEKAKPSPSSWPFFHRLDSLLGATSKNPPKPPPFPQKMRTPMTAVSKKRERSRSRSRSPRSEMVEAMAKLGEVFERVERSKAERTVEMERQRIGFARELEMQRLQFVSDLNLNLNLNLKREGRRGGQRPARRR